ncbi:helix-turn-helix domain-containing protein [Aurantiacibacter flavus]|uniref:Helix-turn-helix domain-containing protein n=1 Tax=Aurantiacibacter flavus TaxID=3145232 RepID=A0ABV0CTD3_9SPHN
MAAIPDKDERCRAIERLITAGGGVCASCREMGVSEKTFYRWRKAQPITRNSNNQLA